MPRTGYHNIIFLGGKSMFCDKCDYKAFSGHQRVCGYYLHGGETVYINQDVENWCPMRNTKNNKPMNADSLRLPVIRVFSFQKGAPT